MSKITGVVVLVLLIVALSDSKSCDYQSYKSEDSNSPNDFPNVSVPVMINIFLIQDDWSIPSKKKT